MTYSGGRMKRAENVTVLTQVKPTSIYMYCVVQQLEGVKATVGVLTVLL